MHRKPDCPNGQMQSRVASVTESCALAVEAMSDNRSCNQDELQRPMDRSTNRE